MAGIENERSRKFSCVTYLSENQLVQCLNNAGDMIRGFAYCYHDKDINDDGTPKEPHTHFILWLYNQRTVKSIKNWFSGYKDEKGQPINTLVQVCHDIRSATEYLWHANDPDKYQYSKDSVVYSDPALFEFPDTQTEDISILALDDLLSGVSVYDCAKKYGRDFIYHFVHISSVYFAVKGERL